MPKFTLVIPCFNEEQRLDGPALLALANGRDDLSLLFVDDGSTDRTAQVIEELRRSAASLHLHQLPANAGKAEAVRAGLRLALTMGADWVGYADADLAAPVEELLRLVRTAADGTASAVLGSRVRLLGARIERRAARHYLGRFFATVASVALRIPVYDTQCGAKLFRRTPALDAALARPFRSRWVFDVELLDRLLRGAADAPPLVAEDFVEVPLRSWRDVGGSRLRLRAMLRAGIDLLAILLRSRRAR